MQKARRNGEGRKGISKDDRDSLKLMVLVIALAVSAYFFLVSDTGRRTIAGRGTAEGCLLLDAYWSTAEINEGQPAEMILVGNQDCDGLDVTFTVYEDDAFLDDTFMTSTQSVFSGNIATATWNAKWVEDWEFVFTIWPEYYFTATLDSLPEKQINNSNQSKLLKVNQVIVGLYNIQVEFLEEDAATIHWESKYDADSQVEYGTSLGYGKVLKNERLTKNHMITIPDLDPDTMYYFRIGSTTAADAFNTSEGSFTTLPHNPNLIIVDNVGSGFSSHGKWIESNITGHYAQDSLSYEANGIPGDYATWQFDIEEPGEYRLYAWWITTSDSASLVTYDISGLDEVQKDQRIGGGWQLLGTFDFPAGANYVKLKVGGTSNGIISADAIKLERVPEASCSSLTGFICDPETENCDGYWLAAAGDYCCNQTCTPKKPSCESKNGFPCAQYEMCPGELIDGAEEDVCCSIECLYVGSLEALRIHPSSVAAGFNEEVELDVYILNADDIYGYSFMISYDADLLEVVGVEYGDLFTEDVSCAPVGTAVGSTTNIECFKNSGSESGTGVVRKLKFKTVNPGTAVVRIENGYFKDSNYNDYPVAVSQATITISGGACFDADNDGYSKATPLCLIGNDCDDFNQAINPGVSETCDGIDNDCDDLIDGDDPDLHAIPCAKQRGVCFNSTKRCEGGEWKNCSDQDYLQHSSNYVAAEEDTVGDGLDNDCDGAVDEFASCNTTEVRFCAEQSGVCVPGIQLCDGFWTECLNKTYGTPEICDGIDNDCFGEVDNGCDDDQDGFCDALMVYNGSTLCSPGDCDDSDNLVHPGALEICNGLNEDCDNVTDEGCDDDQDGYCDALRGYNDTALCDPGDCNDDDDAINPGAEEICDNEDNDCDGAADEGCDDDFDNFCDDQMIFINSFECYLGPGDCDDDDPFVYPGADEACNGKDDDCNGVTDDMTLTDVYNCGSCNHSCIQLHASSICDDGECVVVNCSENYYDINNDGDDGCEYQCNATGNESCDGLDNDCDGLTDETCPCMANETQPCGISTGECTQGLQYCEDGSWGPCVGGVVPSDEACDGKDNDCDGQIDEGLSAPSCQLSIGVCRNAKKRCGGSSGWLPCSASTYGPRYMVLETDDCDGWDNDCDGQVDEGCKKEAVEEEPVETKPPVREEVEHFEDFDEEEFEEGGFNFTIILLAALVMLLLGGIGYLLYTQKKKAMPKTAPKLAGAEPGVEDIEKLKSYIRKTLGMGFTEVEISQALTDAGWHGKDIAEAFSEVKRAGFPQVRKSPVVKGPVQKKLEKALERKKPIEKPDDVFKGLKQFSK